MSASSGQSKYNRVHFIQNLRRALKSLYNPSVLIDSPLLEWLDIEKKGDSAGTLRRILADTIEGLQPTDKLPMGAKSLRLYHVLHQRYVMQWPQHRVAANIGIGDRQLLREEKAGVELLAEILWRDYNLEQKIVLPLKEDLEDKASPASPSSVDRAVTLDLDEINRFIKQDRTPLNSLLRDVLKTLKPISTKAKVKIKTNLAEEQLLYLRGPLLRQALLLIFNQAIAQALLQGEVHVISGVQKGMVSVVIQACTLQTTNFQAGILEPSLETAYHLIRLCGGTLDFGLRDDLPDHPNCSGSITFRARLSLPTPNHALVLLVDDNTDTLQLYQRYLSDSQYRCIAANNARQGLAFARQEQPQAIILDVMMPHTDGWSLLEQLRVHPKTQGIPILVCSIIPQVDLALALGAAEFLQKPVNREDLLAALDRHLAQEVISLD